MSIKNEMTMRKITEKVVTGLRIRPQHYAAVWSPDGFWGRGDTTLDAWKAACRPARFEVLELPEDCELTSVGMTGFTLQFRPTGDDVYPSYDDCRILDMLK